MYPSEENTLYTFTLGTWIRFKFWNQQFLKEQLHVDIAVVPIFSGESVGYSGSFDLGLI